ncbi:hypothetical protein PoB_002725100 [Plakobranchus ocellatus]|uniref:Uncharacterized protein n=1 Tax=Plakobranchus ocellatus TaxID=259542 RepID=A0AAV3ZNU8_9GAST|nr:hypothetical protein PoB_002725100 [Plakobranchus ocellatus]
MSKRLRDAIIGLHAFTGCDSTSCFAGKGKLKALKMLEGDQDHQDTFSRIGTLETISGQDMQVIETFVCQLYGKPSHTSVDKVRYDKVRQCFKSRKEKTGEITFHHNGEEHTAKWQQIRQLQKCEDGQLRTMSRLTYQAANSKPIKRQRVETCL